MFYKPSKSAHLAIVASKKVGKAVARNRAKRVLRAAFASYAKELSVGTYVLIAKSNVNGFDFESSRKKLRWSFKKLGCLM